MKNITLSSWNAQNIPKGITFDKDKGIFSGTPDVNEGEFSVPVSVKTNYGSDTKDVRFVVEGAAHGVYALGSQAARWSNNAEPDDYGFRKLDIPNATRLSTLPAGFAAKCVGGRWFIASSKSATIYGGNGKSNGISYYSPAEFPVDGVLDIKGGRYSNYNGYYFAYRTSDEASLFRYTVSSGNVTSSFSTSRGDISKFQDNFADGWAMLRDDNAVILDMPADLDAYAFNPNENISKLSPDIVLGNGAYTKVFYITDNGKFFECNNGNISQLMPEREDFTDLWVQPAWHNIFALTADKKLYARGTNTIYQLGFNDNSVFNDFTLIGEFDVKKIEATFMLTRDGKLYHTGSAVSGIASQYNEWTHIFPDYKFIDFSYLPYPVSNFGSQTLAAIIDD